MKLNADLARRAAVDSSAIDWAPSPLDGVERRMLERDGDEVARATTIVRFAPDSYFSEHEHSGGEEFIVLAGTFSDQYGDFPAGTYLRNPVGSRHRPHSRDGCTIFVKLHWMHGDDQTFVRTDLGDTALWRPSGVDGVEMMALHAFGEETVTHYRLAPGAAIPERTLPGGEELFVLDGSCNDINGGYGAGYWLRQPGGAVPTLVSEQGCRLYVKRGHLANPPALPLPV